MKDSVLWCGTMCAMKSEHFCMPVKLLRIIPGGTFLFCCGYIEVFGGFHVTYLPILFRVASVALDHHIYQGYPGYLREPLWNPGNIQGNLRPLEHGVVDSFPPSAAYMRQWIGSALAQIMACRLSGTKPLSVNNASLLSIGHLRTNFSAIWIKIKTFQFTEMHLKISSANWWPFCPGGDELIQCQ